MLDPLRRHITQLVARILGAPSEHNLLRPLTQGALGSGGAQVAAAIVALGAQLVLTRSLGAQHYGYFIIAWSWAMLLAIPSRLGFHTSLVRFVTQYRTEHDWPALKGLVHFSMGAVVLASAICAAGLAAGASMLSGILSDEQLRTLQLAGLLVPLLAILGVLAAILRAYRRIALSQFTQRGLVHFGLLILASGVYVAYSLESAVMALGLAIAAAALAVIAVGIYIKGLVDRDVGHVSPTYHRSLWLRTSVPLMWLAGMHVVLSQTDIIMVGAFMGGSPGGVYGIATRLAQLATLGLIATNAIVAPMVAELHTRNDRRQLQRLVTMAAYGVTAFTVLVALVLAAGGSWILAIFGPEFPAGYTPLLILAAGHLVNALCGPVGLLLTMTGHQDEAATVLTGAAVLNLALNAALIPLFGLEGAAVATAASIVAWNVALLRIVRRRLGISPSAIARLRPAPADPH